MSDQTSSPRRTVRFRLRHWLRRSRFYDWKRHDGTWRQRVLDLLDSNMNWGKALMVLTGTSNGGHWSGPEPPGWHYRIGPSKPSPITGYPKHRLRDYEVVKDEQHTYTGLSFFNRWSELDEDSQYEWKHIGVGQDDELYLGHMYDGGRFYGANKVEARLIARYVRMWRRHDWWGLRSWLYEVGLNASVSRTERAVKAARARRAVPPAGDTT